MKKLVSLILAIAIIFCFAGCGDKDTTSSQISESDISSSTQVGNKNPLTGEMNLDKDSINKRPLAIMINNIKISLPQRGISKADMFYETLAEGGITRIMAMFVDPAKIPDLGSVRSARSYYVELAASHNAIFTHAGGSDGAYSTIKKQGIDNIDFLKGVAASYRDKDRIKNRIPTEHTLFTNADLLAKRLKNKNLTAEIDDFFRFGDNTKQMENAEAALNITAPFSNSAKATFTYDSESGLYKKGQFNAPHIDGATGETLTLKNVFLLKTSITNTNDYKNHVAVDLTSGEGYYACGGKVIPIRWQKNGFNKQLKYYTMDNNEIFVAEGKSYVCILPEKSNITFN